MGRMIGPMFADSPLLVIPLGVLILFFVVFAAVSLRAFLRNDPTYEATAQLPLGQDEEAK